MVSAVIGDLSIMVNMVAGLIVLLVWVMAPQTAKTLIKKRLGWYKNMLFNIMCSDDGSMVLQPHTISKESAIEYTDKKGVTHTYYIGRALNCGDDNLANHARNEREKIMLSLGTLDGFKCGISHVAQGVITNAAVITALDLADYFEDENIKDLSMQVSLSQNDVEKFGVKDAIVKIVLLVNPRAIGKYFNKYWSAAMLHSTKMRWKSIGEESNKKNGEKAFKLLLFGGIALCIVLAAIGLVAGWLF